MRGSTHQLILVGQKAGNKNPQPTPAMIRVTQMAVVKQLPITFNVKTLYNDM